MTLPLLLGKKRLFLWWLMDTGHFNQNFAIDDAIKRGLSIIVDPEEIDVSES